MITKEQALKLKYGDAVWSLLQSYPHKMKDGPKSPVRVRVTGRCVTWERRPLAWRLPVKYGLRTNLYITHETAFRWTLDEAEAVKAINGELFYTGGSK